MGQRRVDKQNASSATKQVTLLISVVRVKILKTITRVILTISLVVRKRKAKTFSVGIVANVATRPLIVDREVK